MKWYINASWCAKLEYCMRPSGKIIPMSSSLIRIALSINVLGLSEFTDISCENIMRESCVINVTD